MVKAEETREERMRRKVRKGTARDRDAYVRFRKVTSLPTLIRRRWAARSLPRNARSPLNHPGEKRLRELETDLSAAERNVKSQA